MLGLDGVDITSDGKITPENKIDKDRDRKSTTQLGHDLILLECGREAGEFGGREDNMGHELGQKYVIKEVDKRQNSDTQPEWPRRKRLQKQKKQLHRLVKELKRRQQRQYPHTARNYGSSSVDEWNNGRNHAAVRNRRAKMLESRLDAQLNCTFAIHGLRGRKTGPWIYRWIIDIDINLKMGQLIMIQA